MNKSNVSKEFLERYNKLRDKLVDIANSPVVENKGDEMSLYDLRVAIKDYVGNENKIFIQGIKKDISVMNRRNSFHKNSRTITAIDFVSNKEEGYYCLVYFRDSKGNVTTEKVDNFIKLDVNSNEILRNRKFFNKYLNVLSEFKSKNMDEDYRWSLVNPYVDSKYFTNGIFSYSIDMNKTESDSLFFSNIDDVNICHVRFSGGLSALETIEYYTDSFTKRIGVNLNDIHPYIANVAKKYYQQSNKKLVK